MVGTIGRNALTSFRGVIAVVLVGAILAVTPAVASAAPVVIASDLTSGPPVNLISFADDLAIPFTSAGDGFQKFQRGVSPSIPFSVLDDSLASFPADTAGIVDDNNLDQFFGVTDTVNDDTTGSVAATWVFDISGGTNLELLIDMGAMGDFEASDSFEWTYSIDAGPTVTAFSLVADEAASRTYTLANGTTVVTLNDPLNVGVIPLSNVLQTVSAALTGTGSELALTLTVTADGGAEAAAFQNIVITSDGGGGGPTPGDLVITEVMQNPSAVSDDDGEWFEIQNVSGSDIDIDGWTISDLGADSHVISNGGPLPVPAGGFVVLGNNTNTGMNGGAAVDYSYGGSMFLSNSGDEVVLTDPSSVEFDRIEYDGGPVWPDPTGAAMNLDPASTTSSANDDGNNWCAATTAFGDGDLGTPGAANPVCPEPGPIVAKIHEVQGSGASVAITGQVEVQGIVTSLFERDDALDAFFLQEEDADADADPATSEGIYVFCRGTCPPVATGDLVTVVGSAEEFFGMSQIDIGFGSGTTVIDSSGNALPTPVAVDLPAASSTVEEPAFENVEGMVVTFGDTLVVSEYFQLARFGQIVLTESSRPYQFTHDNAPSVAGNAAFLADLATRRIILDDDSNDNNDATSDGPDEAFYYPEGGLSLGNKFRGGDTITDLTGVMHWSFAGSSGTDAWRIRPLPEAYDYSFVSVNPEPASPADVGGSLQVASFNVLNYFATFDNGPNVCGPSADQDCRGADSAAELIRQRDKIVAALVEMDADVVGLIELQNDADASIAELVGGLNTALGAGTYDYIDTGFIGDDAIKVGFIYKPATVTPVGNFAILDSSVDPTFLDSKNRPALIQTFEEIATSGRFTVAVNHFKSKGSPCDDVGDPGLDDGQANCPGTRAAAATALANYLATDPTGSGDSDFLIIGDLNAYAMEDAITALKAAGYTDLINQFQGSSSYSFVFDGQLGYLDHALANDGLLGQVTGTTTWAINADEVNVFDYNDDIQDSGEASFERETTVGPLYAPDALRSSDHDPVIVGLDLTATPKQLKANTVATLQALLPTGSSKDDKAINKAIDSIEDSLNPDYWADDSYLTEDGRKVFDEEKKAVNELGKVTGSASAAAQSVIDTLVSVDQELAQRAIDIAVTVGGNQSEINTALSEMTNASADVAAGSPDKAIDHYKKAWHHATKAVENARFATFNASLNRFNEGDLATEVASPGSTQPGVIAEIIQRNRPDVLLINEFDYDAAGGAAAGFQNNYLSVSQNGADPINYPFRYTAPSNTGIYSGFDLDNSGTAGDFVPGDSFGFGFFPGQFGMVVYSMFPIDLDETRTFQNFLWKDMPGALLPEDPPGTSYYSPAELDVFRLSSKSHWDLPLVVGDSTVHFLTSHPTPPVFDGPEDRNGTRNFDEIRFWADYVEGGSTASYIYDDNGGIGGLNGSDRFVIAGDQNSDPNDGDSIPGAIQQLLNSPKINTAVTPSSLGGPEQALLQGGANASHISDPAFDTADFADGAPGNLRVDYVLPRKNMKITSAGVFWPLSSDPLFGLVGTFPFPSSDHRLVYIDADVK